MRETLRLEAVDDRPDFVEAGRAMGMSGLVYGPDTDVWHVLADERAPGA